MIDKHRRKGGGSCNSCVLVLINSGVKNHQGKREIDGPTIGYCKASFMDLVVTVL